MRTHRIHMYFAASVALAAQSVVAQEGGLPAEIAARQAADSRLQDDINAETAARSARDTQLQTSIDAEVAARIAADTQLDARVNAEAVARMQAIEELRGSIGGGAATTTVDCSRGQSIGEVLRSAERPLTVVVRGACMESVVIGRDDVSLVGDGGSITGSVTIAGARRAVLADLSITNPAGDGIVVTDGASVTIRNNQINDSSGYGIVVRNASFANVNDNHMLRNGIVGNTNIDASGIGVGHGSTVRALRNEIGENANSGIEVFEGGFYRSEGDTIAMRTSAPGRSAVDVFRRGHAELRGATVSGNVFVNQQSQLQARNITGQVSRFTNGLIDVSGLSFFRLRAGVVRQASTLACGGGSNICQCDATPPAPCPGFVP